MSGLCERRKHGAGEEAQMTSGGAGETIREKQGIKNGKQLNGEQGRRMEVKWGSNGNTQRPKNQEHLERHRTKAGDNQSSIINGAIVKAGATERWRQEEGLIPEVKD